MTLSYVVNVILSNFQQILAIAHCLLENIKSLRVESRTPLDEDGGRIFTRSDFRLTFPVLQKHTTFHVKRLSPDLLHCLEINDFSHEATFTLPASRGNHAPLK